MASFFLLTNVIIGHNVINIDKNILRSVKFQILWIILHVNTDSGMIT